MKVAFIGPEQYCQSFKLIGFKTFQANSQKQALEVINNLKTKEFGAVFASRDVLEKQIEGVVILPGLNKKEETDSLKEIIKKAIGKEVKLQS